MRWSQIAVGNYPYTCLLYTSIELVGRDQIRAQPFGIPHQKVFSRIQIGLGRSAAHKIYVIDLRVFRFYLCYNFLNCHHCLLLQTKV